MHSVTPAEWNSLNQFSCLLGQRCSQHFSHLTQVNPWHVLTLQRCHFGSHVAFGIKANTSAWKWCCRTSLSFLLRLLLGVIAWSPMLLHGSLALFAQTFCYRCLQASKLERFSVCPYIPWDQPCVDNGKINEVKGGSQRRFLDLILFLYSWSKESGRSAPPMCLLYTSITCEHGMETCVFPFPDQCFASPAGLLPTKVDRR